MSNLLRMEKINKSFNQGTLDEVKIFKDFSLNIEEGEFVSVVGSNGSGKTTLLNIISGNVDIDGGEVFLKDELINGKKEFIRARRIGRVYQDPSAGTAPEMTIGENLALAENKGNMYGLSFALTKKKIAYYKELLKPLNLGLENKINSKVKTLSGGERQTLALLMVTMQPIDILLLDEHTAALDPVTSQMVMELTNKIIKEKNITTLMVTHNLRFACEYGSRLLMMNKGEVVVDVRGEEKEKTKVEDLLQVFNEISIECGN